MSDWQVLLLTLLIVISIMSGWISWFRITRDENAFGETPWLWWLGIYVWGDAVLIAPFWTVAAGISLWRRDILLFLLLGAAFWFVRGMGEMVYWLNQQFSPIKREPPEKFWHYAWFKNDAVWFVNQLWNQLLMTLSLVGMIVVAVEMIKR